MFERKKYFSTFIWGFAVGAVSGAAVALLTTPMTGRKLQRKVSDIGEKVIDKVDELKKAARSVAA